MLVCIIYLNAYIKSNFYTSSPFRVENKTALLFKRQIQFTHKVYFQESHKNDSVQISV
ncbi:MAG: hypothetical protein RL660_1124 [Bacteroidota bacterium]|jgi:hypothetical protein